VIRSQRIGGNARQRAIEIIDLEKDRVAVDLERAKVMFFVWIVFAENMRQCGNVRALRMVTDRLLTVYLLPAFYAYQFEAPLHQFNDRSHLPTLVSKIIADC
jgi:hypothetical protein